MRKRIKFTSYYFTSMRATFIIFLIGLSLLTACQRISVPQTLYKTENLTIQQLTDNIFVHISPIKLSNGSLFPCNGMIYKNGQEVMVFDTPVENEVAEELISWIRDELKCSIKGIVVNHHHIDCLGGLQAFHDVGISSIANQLTIELAAADSVILPQTGFDEKMELAVGNEQVINQYFGKGHTADNIVSYVPAEKTLFGGCMIKAVGAGKGNLADADTTQWSLTVQKIKENWPEVEIVIPGHQKAGGAELLDFTIEMFQPEKTN